MSSPVPPALQGLRHLNGSSPTFHDQLASVLYGEEYRQCVQTIQGDDLVWLVDYLDNVRRRAALLALRSSRCRLSMVSITPVVPPGSVYANSEVSVALGRCSRRRIRFRYTSSMSNANLSPLEVMVMCIMRSSVVQGFASNVYVYTLKMAKRLLKCVIEPVASLVLHHRQVSQTLCQEAVMWKRLTHPNVLSLLGVTITPLQLISNLMPGGDLPDYIETNPDADRLGLVCPSCPFYPRSLPLPVIRRC